MSIIDNHWGKPKSIVVVVGPRYGKTLALAKEMEQMFSATIRPIDVEDTECEVVESKPLNNSNEQKEN